MPQYMSRSLHTCLISSHGCFFLSTSLLTVLSAVFYLSYKCLVYSECGLLLIKNCLCTQSLYGISGSNGNDYTPQHTYFFSFKSALLQHIKYVLTFVSQYANNLFIYIYAYGYMLLNYC